MISEGNSRASYVTQTQEQARLKARDLVIKNQSEVLLHGVNGKIRTKDSYGNDPYPAQRLSKRSHRNVSAERWDFYIYILN